MNILLKKLIKVVNDKKSFKKRHLLVTFCVGCYENTRTF